MSFFHENADVVWRMFLLRFSLSNSPLQLGTICEKKALNLKDPSYIFLALQVKVEMLLLKFKIVGKTV